MLRLCCFVYLHFRYGCELFCIRKFKLDWIELNWDGIGWKRLLVSLECTPPYKRLGIHNNIDSCVCVCVCVIRLIDMHIPIIFLFLFHSILFHLIFFLNSNMHIIVVYIRRLKYSSLGCYWWAFSIQLVNSGCCCSFIRSLSCFQFFPIFFSPKSFPFEAHKFNYTQIFIQPNERRYKLDL